jgi:hypothetical protein
MNDFNDKQLSEINQNLANINKKMGNYWYSFARGLLTGLGSVVGAGLAIILIGWFLNVIGVIPALKNSAEQWRNALQQTQDTKSFVPTENAQ